MLKLILLIALVYIGRKVYKSWGRLNATLNGNGFGRGKAVMDDVMIQDPYCQVYFPRRSGVQYEHNGNVLFFCSSECRDLYIQDMKEKKREEG